MAYYSINDIYREKIYSFNEKQMIIFLDKLVSADKERCLHIIVSDGFQILCRRKHNLIDHLSSSLVSILQKSNFVHIKTVLENNYQLFQILFANAKVFWSLPIIDRCILIGETYTYEEHRKMLLLDPLYIIDACVYSIQKDMDSFNEYHEDYLQKMGIIGLPAFYDLLVTIMNQLKKENLDMYFDNLLEMVKGFYISYKFLGKMDKKLVLDITKIGKMVETQSLEKVEESLHISLKEFSRLIGQYFLYKNDLENSGEINSFIEESISPNMIKKLKITI